jgi:hypothetical protein
MQKQNHPLTDEAIKEKARFLAAAVGNNANHLKANSTSWFEKFKQKNGVRGSKFTPRASKNSSTAFGSRHGSINSQGSGRGHSASMDLDDAGTPGYHEIVFNSRSNRPGSRASPVSACSVASSASRRTGPLSEWAKAGMNAVKKIGACWRCKL